MIKFIKKRTKIILNKIRLNQRNNSIVDFDLISFKSNVHYSTIGKDVRLAAYSDINNSLIGEFTSIGKNSKISSTNLGKFCAISWNVTINAIEHPLENISISAFPYVPEIGNFVEIRTQERKIVDIGNDVWIGAHSVIMPGIKIGNGVVVGAGCVVTKDIPDYAIVVGVPSRILKFRFSKEIIEELLTIKWWDLNENIIKQNIKLFQEKLTLEVLKKLKKCFQ